MTAVGDLLELWWVVPAAWVVVGHVLSWLGLSPAQRAVWATARIVRVEQPAHGASKQPGIPVTLAFRDPSTGREFTLPNTGRHGVAVREAWVGRELEVRYPRGRPDRFRVVFDPDEKKGRTGPHCALVLLLVGLVIHTAVARGFPWALLGFGALLVVAAAVSPDIRLARARDALLASAVAVPARVVSVTRDVYTDGEGAEIVNHAPVITFTTREGTDVTVLCLDGIPDPRRSLGRALTLHYAPSDPAVYTPDPAADRRSNERAIGAIVLLAVAGVAGIVAGAVTL
ncbi:DUF3592 domain-containing protein [Streptomyces silvensis]|uniref:DUF3592 domain-containing protein n=1 Tax=Streptomyces silvensis TaxID=1765722 RepID=A0A0W7X8D2_9ACTN|nr:DUF3592 domain-containing protein [Streptomyces silvensis]KUF19002.1 hypothetical protein AT728_08330 [Streptomyces silvensis]